MAILDPRTWVRALLAAALMWALACAVTLVRDTAGHDWYAAGKLTLTELLTGVGFDDRAPVEYRTRAGVADNCKCPICVNRKCPTLKIAKRCTSGQSVGKSQQEWSGERMHGWETRMLLRHYLERGVTRAELSRRFGVDRRTIHRWVSGGELERDAGEGTRYTARPRVEHKLEPYKGIIEARLEEYPRLSAKRLFDEVRAAGYTGGYGRVRDYVRSVRPREAEEEVVRFETPAGRQGQVDFATFTLPWGRRHALVTVLGYSRLLWLRFYRRQTMAVLTEGLESAFGWFGGVPRELLFDQMRSVVVSDGRADGGELVLNAEFLRFASHWGFQPRSCRPYRARTKGKVERPIRYIRESFFYGRKFLNDEDLNEQARRWLEGTANVRRHGTTGERPVDRFERDEQQALLPLADRPYRRLGARPLPAARRRLPTTVDVERRPLRVYAEAVQ